MSLRNAIRRHSLPGWPAGFSSPELPSSQRFRHSTTVSSSTLQPGADVFASDALRRIQHNLAPLRQAVRYREVLVEKYQEPQRLRCIAVVSLGFDRIVWQML